ncbi:unnamed protein product [Citrullus colocynthis]|uniref:Uncharacterized protein n=1 Tax=Citrullus colocynthis TaxID=252529 RepID=A0ABP0YND2_9ROSI
MEVGTRERFWKRKKPPKFAQISWMFRYRRYHSSEKRKTPFVGWVCHCRSSKLVVVAPVTRWKPPPVSSHNCHRHTTGERRSRLKFCREGGGGCVNVKGEETRERRKEKRKLGGPSIISMCLTKRRAHQEAYNRAIKMTLTCVNIISAFNTIA